MPGKACRDRLPWVLCRDKGPLVATEMAHLVLRQGAELLGCLSRDTTFVL